MDSNSEQKIRSLISQLIAREDAMESDQESESNLESDTESKFISVIIQIIFVVSSMDLDSQPKPESELMSLVSQATAVFNSMDLDSQPEPLVKLISLISKKISLVNSLASDLEPDSEFMSLVDDIVSPEPEPELISVIKQVLSLFEGTDSGSEESELDSDLEPESKVISMDSNSEASDSGSEESELDSDLKPESKLISMDSDAEAKLISLIAELMRYNITSIYGPVTSRTTQIISVVSSMDLASRPKPESELMSLVTQTVSVFNSMDMDSQPQPLSELISLITRNFPYSTDSLSSPVQRTMDLKPEPELISLIHKIFSLVLSKSSMWNERISLCPQVQVRLEEGKVYEEVPLRSNNKWDCLPSNCQYLSRFYDTPVYCYKTPFFCYGCNGENHQEYKQAPVEVKHSLHPKHSLQLVLLDRYGDRDRDGKRCYCCNGELEGVIYYCSACDFAITFSCVEKPPVLSINHPKWHEHKLALFSRTTSLTCDVCALVDSTCPLYICPPCGFVAHQRCLSLPRVIRISRHPHRISFTHSFDRGGWSCGVCRRKVDNDYGGYTCKKNGCSYAAHSKCATQSNVWDGIELEGVPEETEEELEPPFVRIGAGIIQHFSHENHHLKLDENTRRDYDEYQLCQACVTPIHYGNFYYCLQCEDFILHEKCANLSRKIYNPIHPHMLTLVTDDIDVFNEKLKCSACPWWCTGFFYKCGNRQCTFRVHLQCATISEPLDHESHRHPLFLTSKPGERRRCEVCNDSRRTSRDPSRSSTDETFNCIECDFALCFACATLPQKVRYKHDNHMLTLSYGEETSTVTYWCEACEGKINPQKRFYKCDEYCCVTLHIECLVENGLYMKPGVWWTYYGYRIMTVEANNHRMSLPFCDGCGDGKHCPYNFYFIYDGGKFCSISCCKSQLSFLNGMEVE